MKSSLKRVWQKSLLTYKLLLLALITTCLWAELSPWVRFVDVASNLESVFFRSLPVPGGLIAWRRSPRESREELNKVITQSPSRADLYALRALESERQLDFAAAESDWTKHTDIATSKLDAYTSKADYHHRRLEPQKELESLRRAISQPAPAVELELPADQQSSWKLALRAIQVVQDQDLRADVAMIQYRTLIDRYPKEASAYATFADFLLLQQSWTEYSTLADTYKKSFPNDQAGLLRFRARLERARGSGQTALALYEKAFRPDWDGTLVYDYFQLIKETKSQRQFLAAARNQLQAEPASIEPVARLFYYYQQQGNLAAGRRILLEYRQRKENRKLAWTADELHFLAQYFEAAGDVPESAKLLYSEYALDSNSERALVNLTRLLVDSADQPIRFGQGDLSLYRDIGSMDSNPGFWNGILSLLLNGQSLDMEMNQQEDKAVAYFHHAKGAELIALLDKRFPNSTSRAELHAQLIEAYGRHGASESVLTRGRLFLNSFPDSPQRVVISLLMASSYAAKKDTPAEFGIYENLLKELSTKAGNRPLGTVADGKPQSPRSPDYVRVLGRYVGRFVALNRLPDALALYRRELDRNPNDPALYERLATFFEQNKLVADAEAVYRRALTKFQDTSWHHRFARFLLRQKQNQKVAELTGQVAKVFSGTDLERYFAQSFEGGNLDSRLFLQVNQYASQRFPHHMQFVKNLMSAYTATGTANPAAWEKLMRAHWHYDPILRDQFFAYLSRTGKLETELAALRTANPAQPAELVKSNPAALQWMAECESWRSHFENAAPLLAALAEEQPADIDLVSRSVSVHRSLSAFDPPLVLKALSMQEKLQRAHPTDESIATTLGEISADREWFYKAKPVWSKMPLAAPGRSELYLNAATVFWDYYQYDDALRLMAEGRKRANSPAMFGFETGAIYENSGDLAKAIAEYRQAALFDQDINSRNRLIRLARRPQLRDAIETATSQPVNNPAATTVAALNLRTSLLDSQSRRDDLLKLATATAAGSTDWEVLDQLKQLANEKGFDEVSLMLIDRQVTLNYDPLEKLRLRLQKARLEENLGRTAAAAISMDALYRENPMLLGIVRASVDSNWRNKNFERAVNILMEASAKAWPGLATDLRLEAADKASRSNQYALAARISDGLLSGNPLDARFVAAKADLLFRQNDSRGLSTFYQLKITEAKGNPGLIANFRRNLIPALTRLNDFAGATEQYIQLINQFPDDWALATEAAQYASARSQTPRLKDFYAKAETDSPKDHRWPVVTARLETAWENQVASLDAYTRALKIRPERVDLWTAKATIEERLRRWDDLAATYTKLYDLSYKNASWLENAAEVRARQGRGDEAEKILKQAYLDGRPAASDNYFIVAKDLAAWNLPEKAIPLWEAGFPLIAQSANANQPVREYASTMAKLRRFEDAMTKLKALTPRDEGLLSAGLEGICESAGLYFTPEELSRFAVWLNAQSTLVGTGNLAQLARRANLQDVAAKLEFANLQSMADTDEVAFPYRTFVQNQRSRLQFDQLGQQLEVFSRVAKAGLLNEVLADAIAAYHSAGNEVAELRILLRLTSRNPEYTERLIDLLSRRDPTRLNAMITGSGEFDATIANFALRNGNVALTARALSRPTRQPVWRGFYKALVGVYFADTSPAIDASFRNLLGPELIGERLARKPDPNLNVTGNTWFYVAARLGAHHADTNYLTAMVEQNPSNGNSHEELADYFQAHGKPAEALDSYQRALTWNGDLIPSKIRAAGILAGQGRKEESLKLLQAALRSMQSPSQSTDALPELIATATQAGLANDLKSPIASLVTSLLKRSGNYAVQPLLNPLLKLYQGKQQLTTLLISAARSLEDPARALVEFSSYPQVLAEPLLRESIRLAQVRLTRTYGPEKASVESDLASYQTLLMRRLIESKKPLEAQQILDAWTEEQKRTREDVLPIDLQIAAATNAIPTRLALLGSNAPTLESMRNAALDLRRAGYPKEASMVLDYALNQVISAGSKDPSLFLDLAANKFDQSDAQAALVLLRRMVLVSTGGSETYSLAADLLINRNRAEAGEFLKARLDLVPWDVDAKSKVAQLEKDSATLASIAESATSPYQTRLNAASWLGKNAKQSLNSASAELDQIASANFTTPEQPYSFALRLAAAASAAPAMRLRLLLGAAAIAPLDPRLNLLLAKAVADAGDSRLANVLAQRFTTLHDADLLARIARLLDAPAAILMWQQALTLAKVESLDKVEKVEWLRAQKMVQAKLNAQAQNEGRRPNVAAELEQNRVVKPRLKPEQMMEGQ